MIKHKPLLLFATLGSLLIAHAGRPRPFCHPKGSSRFPQVGDKLRDCFDGCNDCSNCICTENGVQTTASSVCTERFCLPSYQPPTQKPKPIVTPGPEPSSPVCHPKGSSQFPQVGDMIASCFDGCNGCSDCICTENGPSPTPKSRCTQRFCGDLNLPTKKPTEKPVDPVKPKPDGPIVCHPRGSSKRPQVGDRIPGCPADDGCNSCSNCICTENGPKTTSQSICTLRFCFPTGEPIEPIKLEEPKPEGPIVCHPRGSSKRPQVGDKIPGCPAEDRCNSCSNCICTENGPKTTSQSICTLRFCLPAGEPIEPPAKPVEEPKAEDPLVCHPRGSSKHPQVGDMIPGCPASDGCNSCSNCVCTENGPKTTSQSICTLKFCLPVEEPIKPPTKPVEEPNPENSIVCHPRGSSKRPQVGDRIPGCPANDGCNQCSNCVCTENGPKTTSQSLCTLKFCLPVEEPINTPVVEPVEEPKNPDEPIVCHPKGSSKRPQVGDMVPSCKSDCNGCNNCICTENGPTPTAQSFCTLIACEATPPPPPPVEEPKYVQTPTCHPKGSLFKPQVGDTLPSCSDGCNTCFECLCTENGLKLLPTSSCTEAYCSDQPEETRLKFE